MISLILLLYQFSYLFLYLFYLLSTLWYWSTQIMLCLKTRKLRSWLSLIYGLLNCNWYILFLLCLIFLFCFKISNISFPLTTDKYNNKYDKNSQKNRQSESNKNEYVPLTIIRILIHEPKSIAWIDGIRLIELMFMDN